MNRKALVRWGGWTITLLTVLGIGVMLLPYFWMVSSSQKAGAEVFIFRKPFADDFDGNFAVKGSALFGKVHFGHPAATNALQNLICPKLGAFKF